MCGEKNFLTPKKLFDPKRNPARAGPARAGPARAGFEPRNGCSKLVQNWSGLDFQSQKSGPGRSAGDYSGVSPGDLAIKKEENPGRIPWPEPWFF